MNIENPYKEYASLVIYSTSKDIKGIIFSCLVNDDFPTHSVVEEENKKHVLNYLYCAGKKNCDMNPRPKNYNGILIIE